MRIKSILFKVLLVIIGIIGILGQLQVFERKLNLSMLSYFTVLSNLAVIVYFIIDIVFIIFHEKTFSYTIKYMLMMAITVTGLVAHFMLTMSFSFNNMTSFSFLIVHYIIPIMTVLDWLIFDEKGNMKLFDPFKWTIAPLIYALGVFIIASMSNNFFNGNRFPYPFLDTSINSLPVVIITIVGMVVFFLGLGYLYRFIDIKLKQHSHKRNYNI
ncbi:MAG: Pr6Pr family membrane protein [Thomasclavelia sp.]|nr:Pr6Pr family membrane protein [Thomasclavelia sp.]